MGSVCFITLILSPDEKNIEEDINILLLLLLLLIGTKQP